MDSEIRKAIELAFIFQYRADSSDIDLYEGWGSLELDWYQPGRDSEAPRSFEVREVEGGYEFVEV